jgi:hypothetical protein
LHAIAKKGLNHCFSKFMTFQYQTQAVPRHCI